MGGERWGVRGGRWREAASAHARGADSVKLPRSKNLGAEASASMSSAILNYLSFVRLLAV